MAKEIEIIRAWKHLVRKSGSKMPRRNDLQYIYSSWCPDETMDVIHIREKRPVLKEMLKQSIEGTLQVEVFPIAITKRKEFQLLWREVHGDIDPVSEKDLIKWSKSNLKKTKNSMWENVDSRTKNWLVACYLRYRNLENSMNEIRIEMKGWINRYRDDLRDLEEFLEANPDLAKDRHHQKIEVGRQRMDDASEIYVQVPKYLDEKRELLRAEIFDVLFDNKELKDYPSWADKIDKEYVEKSVGMMRKGSELGVDDVVAKNELILEKLRHVFEDFNEVEKRMSSLLKSFEI